MKILMAEHTFYDSEIKVGCHHLATELAKEHEIFYLSTPLSPFHKVHKKNRENFNLKYSIYKNGGKRQSDTLFEYIPYTHLPIANFPLLNSGFVAKNTLNFCSPSLKKILKKEGFLDVDLVIISTYQFHGLLSMVNYKKSIYRITDDFTKFSSVPKSVKKIEENLIKSVDEVVTTAKLLKDKALKIKGSSVRHISNGVKLDNFVNRDYIEPKVYKESSFKKRVIYVGAIEDWFNMKLLKACSEKYPDVEFSIIGPVKTDNSLCSSLNNVKFLGLIPNKDIANYIYHSDVCIIPFIVNDLIRGVSPIKFYEYASMRKTIVSTYWDELDFSIKGIYLSKTFEEFVENIGKALDYSGDREELFNFAQSNTWESKAKKILM